MNEDDRSSEELKEWAVSLFNTLPSSWYRPENIINTNSMLQIYKTVLGHEMFSTQVLDRSGAIESPAYLPPLFQHIIRSIQLKSLDRDELDANFNRYNAILQPLIERSIEDILFYKSLFVDLFNTIINRINSGEYEKEEDKFTVAAEIVSIALTDLLYTVSRRKTGPFTYILGVAENGRVTKKALPGVDLKNANKMLTWIKNVFEAGHHAVSFYALNSEDIGRLVDDGEIWTHAPYEKTSDSAEDDFAICDQLLRFGQEHKQYFSPRPHEILIRSDGIETITVLDSPKTNSVVYKVKYSTGGIAIGRVNQQPKTYGYIASDFLARGLGGNAWYFGDYGRLFALVGAIARDMFVCEERDRFYKIKDEKIPSTERKGPTIKWLPRFKIISHDVKKASTSPLGDRVFNVAPAYVTGHIRRLGDSHNVGEHQLELAKQFGIVVPQGYTFVRPHERVGYDTSRDLYKSRSALHVLFS